MLKGLDRMYNTRCRTEELMAMGVQLGADVPFFITDLPAVWATGIGERLQPAVPLAGYRIVLVNPGFAVATAWVYKNFALTGDEKKINLKNCYQDLSGADRGSPFTGRAIRPDELRNDLEKVTISRYGVLKEIQRRLLQGGAAAALMSGSGPSVYGLFSENLSDRAAGCCRELQREFQATFLVNPLRE